MGVSHSLLKQPYNSIAYRILLVLLWTQFTVLNFVKAIIARLPFIGSLSEIFIPVCIILAAMASLPWFLRRVKGYDVLFYWLYVFVVLVTMGFFTQNRAFLQEDWFSILIAAVPAYFIGTSFSFRTCSRDLFWCSVVGVVCVLFYRMYLLNSGVILEADDMDAAYKLLPSVMYIICYASIKKQKLYWIIAMASLPVLFIFGTRGPIICVLVYFMVLVVMDVMRTRNIKKFILFFIIITIIFAVVVNESVFLRIISTVSSAFERIGFSTRIFDYFIAGNMLESKGREYLIKSAMAAIIENPIKGYGFMGDRDLLGFYVHNIWVEIWCHFGIILGTIIILAMLGLSGFALIKCRKRKEFKFVLMLVCLVFIKLSLSGSYVFEPYLYLMLGYSVAICRRPKTIHRHQYRHHSYHYSEEKDYEEISENAFDSMEKFKEKSQI
jgi:hypothetical protein